MAVKSFIVQATAVGACIKQGEKGLKVTNTLAYYGVELITAVKKLNYSLQMFLSKI